MIGRRSVYDVISMAEKTAHVETSGSFTSVTWRNLIILSLITVAKSSNEELLRLFGTVLLYP